MSGPLEAFAPGALAEKFPAAVAGDVELLDGAIVAALKLFRQRMRDAGVPDILTGSATMAVLLAKAEQQAVEAGLTVEAFRSFVTAANSPTWPT